MGWNTRSSRVLAVEEHLVRTGVESAVAGATQDAIEREVAVYELVAAALMLNARSGAPGGPDWSKAAAACRERFESFSRDEWHGLLDQARHVMRLGASYASWPERSRMLERLIAAVLAAR